MREALPPLRFNGLFDAVDRTRQLFQYSVSTGWPSYLPSPSSISPEEVQSAGDCQGN
jgi:hypothetical protein